MRLQALNYSRPPYNLKTSHHLYPFTLVQAIITSHLGNCFSLLTDLPTFLLSPTQSSPFPETVTFKKKTKKNCVTLIKAFSNAYNTLHDQPYVLWSHLLLLSSHLICSSHTHLLQERSSLSAFDRNVPRTSRCIAGSLCVFRYLPQCYLIRQAFLDFPV